MCIVSMLIKHMIQLVQENLYSGTFPSMYPHVTSDNPLQEIRTKLKLA